MRKRSLSVRGFALSALLCGTLGGVSAASLTTSHPTALADVIAGASSKFSAQITPAFTSLPAKGTFTVSVAVTQKGDVEHNEVHSLPKSVTFELFDGTHRYWERGALVSPVSAEGGVGYEYVGNYQVHVPNPSKSLSDLRLQLQSFRMQDNHRAGEKDDTVPAVQYAEMLGIVPPLPNFTAMVIPSGNSWTGKQTASVTVTVTQNGDVEHAETHVLPKNLTFVLQDSAHHRWSVVGHLNSPFSAPGTVGAKYSGVYSFEVPNPDSITSGVTVSVNTFHLLDGRKWGADDKVDGVTFSGTVGLNPAPPAFVATVTPQNTTISGGATLNVNVTVTQNGDVEHSESHALPQEVRFEFFTNGQWWAEVGKLAAPVTQRGANGATLQGVYAVKIPNPSSPLTNVMMKLDGFSVLDNGKKVDKDDSVDAAPCLATLSINPTA